MPDAADRERALEQRVRELEAALRTALAAEAAARRQAAIEAERAARAWRVASVLHRPRPDEDDAA